MALGLGEKIWGNWQILLARWDVGQSEGLVLEQVEEQFVFAELEFYVQFVVDADENFVRGLL